MQAEPLGRVLHDFIRYANCWEDAAVLTAALQPGTGKCCLSIASGGDNALALLATGASVVAADLNHTQLACLELKAAGFRNLAHSDLLAFLGIRPCDARRSLYAQLRGDLSPAARRFWDDKSAALAAGMIHAGKFEQYFNLFRRSVVPLMHSRAVVAELLAEKDASSRARFYREVWDNRRWRFLFRLFFSRLVMGRLGRDPAFFREVDGPVASRILSRTRYALTELTTHDNPFLTYILTGNFGKALPEYLHPDRHSAIRAGLGRLTLHHGSIADAAEKNAAGGFDGFNLSDIFEYLGEAGGEQMIQRLLACARPGARFAYWNMLAPRRFADRFSGQMRERDDLAAPLHARDRAFFYQAFIVEEAL